MSHVVSAEQVQADTDKTILGFWVYILTDCVLFASLFATYAVLRNGTAGGPSGADLFNLPYVLTETLLLLTSSFTSGLGLLAARKHNKTGVLIWLGITFALGATFVGMELHEFSSLVQDGNSWRRSGFLSAFFTLVGTHGLHITAGLIWLVALVQQVVQKGFTSGTMKRLQLFSLFWHFLDIVWIFIFTIVYLIGVIKV
jgi:cytochrome o ubiquinol oxidase subunit 3